MLQFAIEHGHINSWFTRLKWWFFIVMLVYQKNMWIIFILWMGQRNPAPPSSDGVSTQTKFWNQPSFSTGAGFLHPQYYCNFKLVSISFFKNLDHNYPLVNKHSYGKSPCLMGQLTVSMAIFNSYVKLPDDNYQELSPCFKWVNHCNLCIPFQKCTESCVWLLLWQQIQVFIGIDVQVFNKHYFKLVISWFLQNDFRQAAHHEPPMNLMVSTCISGEAVSFKPFHWSDGFSSSFCQKNPGQMEHKNHIKPPSNTAWWLLLTLLKNIKVKWEYYSQYMEDIYSQYRCLLTCVSFSCSANLLLFIEERDVALYTRHGVPLGWLGCWRSSFYRM